MKRNFILAFFCFLFSSCGDSNPKKDADVCGCEFQYEIVDWDLDIVPETDIQFDQPQEQTQELDEISPDEAGDILPEQEEQEGEFGAEIGPEFNDELDILEVVPEIPGCITEGCAVRGSNPCCPGLTPVHECDPSSGNPECTEMFCVRLGDGNCSPHENCYNSLHDCTNPCQGGIGVSFPCSMIETQMCECHLPECHPVCRGSSGVGSGWFDSCSNDLIRPDEDCMRLRQVAECRNVCTRSEGWYENITGELIKWDLCSPTWECQIIW